MLAIIKKIPAGRTFGMAGAMFAIWALIQVAFVIGVFLGVVCCSFGFILMTDERAMIDLEEATNRSIRANRELAEAVEGANSAIQRAAASDAAKSKFVAIVSHEIRNQLSGAMAMTDLLLDTDLTIRETIGKSPLR
jgi:signal transduction histidine kinase